MIMMHKGRQQSRNMRHIINQRGRLVRSSQRGSDQWQRTGWGHSVVCRTDFSVAASGIYDARAHAKGTHHKEKTAERGTMKSIQSLFTGQESIKVSLQMFTE